MPAPFTLYSTMTRRVEAFKPIEEGHVGLYVCGMTVYDQCHVGHAMAMVIFDTFVRYLRFRGWDVTFVRNFTDIDDKIINRAAELGEDPADLAKRYIEAFHRDLDQMGLIRPDHEPKVSESISEIIEMINRLVDGEHAYESDGSVWFAVESTSRYGQLSGQKLEGLKSADEVAGKRHPADFALWKAVKPGEPAWPSPWGEGRPGWHIECSAMSYKVFGPRFDIHGGGMDLLFPHHENEVAQSECGNNSEFANYWMHNGLLTMSGGQKMGKSLGNVFNVEDVLSHYPAETLRLYYLQNHYRSPLPWGEDALPDALLMLNRLYEAKEVALAMKGSEPVESLAKSLGPDAEALLQLATTFEERFFKVLDDDFNTGAALGLIFELARALNRFSNHKKARKRGGPLASLVLTGFSLAARALGLTAMDVESFFEEVKNKRLAAMGISRNEIESLLDARQDARAAKDWTRADEIRGELSVLQVLVMDRPDGVCWRLQIKK